jgi:hypothetical protein
MWHAWEKGNVCRVFCGKYEKPQHMKLGDNIEVHIKELE